MKHISDILQKRVKESGLSANIETALIIDEFNKLIKQSFGDQFVTKIKPVFIKNQVLQVNCSSSVIVQEMSFQKGFLISSINQFFKKKVLKDIKFSL